MEKTKYVVGRNNLACTIFVPFDCANNCPFCTSKSMYKEMADKFDIEAIIQKIFWLNMNFDIREYVITGGEPFADLTQLKRIINAMNKNVYINTTLPLYYKNIDEVIDFINDTKRIKGINISRHMSFDFPGVAGRNMIDFIKKPVRINTVLNDKSDLQNLKKFIEFWGSPNRIVNIRADYRKIKSSVELRYRDYVEEWLAKEYYHMGSGGCMVCNTTTYDADNCEVHYHRGMMYSSVRKGENIDGFGKVYINDVIITPDGNIYPDWDFVEDKEFNKWVMKKQDMPATIIEFIIDWTGEGGQKFYFNSNRIHKFSITKNKDQATLINNKMVYDEVIKEMKKKTGEFLKNINPIIYDKVTDYDSTR